MHVDSMEVLEFAYTWANLSLLAFSGRYADPKILFTLPPTAYFPRPNVNASKLPVRHKETTLVPLRFFVDMRRCLKKREELSGRPNILKPFVNIYWKQEASLSRYESQHDLLCCFLGHVADTWPWQSHFQGTSLASWHWTNFMWTPNFFHKPKNNGNSD